MNTTMTQRCSRAVPHDFMWDWLWEIVQLEATVRVRYTDHSMIYRELREVDIDSVFQNLNSTLGNARF